MTGARWLAVVVGLLVGLLVASPASGVAEVEVHTDIAYAQPSTGRGHLLDLYVPRKKVGVKRPLLIFTGGSGWRRDDGKEEARVVAPTFNAAGYVVAGVSTRSSSQAVFPGQVHDIKAAIRWLRANAGTYGIDRSRFAVMGDSSGGWTAVMAGVTGDVRALEGDLGVTGVSSKVQAVVDIYGPTDFLQMDQHMLPGACAELNEILGLTDCHSDPGSPESLLLGCALRTCPDRVRAANPITYVSPNDPPVLIVHGQDDMLVPHHQSELLVQALKNACVPARFVSVPGGGHNPDIVSLDAIRVFLDRALE